MDCPVCQYKKLNPIATNCPSCETDLVQWSLLNEVESQHVENIKARVSLEGELKTSQRDHREAMHRQKRRFNNLVLLLLTLPLLNLICTQRPLPPVKQSIIISNDSIDHYKKANQALQTQIEALQTQEVSQIEYIIQEGDRLVDLGQLFYNDPNAGYLIGKQNAVANPRRLQPGDTLTIRFR
ncbi:MAG: hypothetical protein AAFP19_06805 [Bacteroidota bacterium]